MARKHPHGRPVQWVKHERKKFSKEEREIIFIRDNYTCQLCGKDLTELPQERVLDHKVPLAQLGSNKFTNIWLLCDPCDKTKKATILPCVVRERLAQLELDAQRRRKGYKRK